jgi:NAD(P)-dependent dehydrogenase (short-subunit alcohol dehydrogenase family)
LRRESHTLNGKVAVVTGGGRGIGAATAEALSNEGVKVAICDIDPASAQQVADRLDNAIGLGLDVSDRVAFSDAMDRVETQLGPIDILVNNAGIMPLSKLGDEPPEVVDKQLEINLAAVIHGTKDGIERMLPRGVGHVVNISSILGRVGLAEGATYSACKFGVYGFSEAVRREIKGTGVEITVIVPAVVKTQLAAGIKSARGVRLVGPDEVATAIVTALKSPRFEVYVPKVLGPLLTFTNLLPYRLRDRFGRLLNADRLLVDADSSQRESYENAVRND